MKQKKNLLKKIVLSLVTILICLLILEISLRMFPGMFGQSVKNQLLTKYTTTKDGIFYFDDENSMRKMKPNFETTVYFNDYVWQHKTDSKGFRNNTEHSTADVILLGDSIIYGHGVDKTVADFIEELSDYTVVNMAAQGDCIFQQKYSLNIYGEKIKPKYVFYFFFENDISDLSFYLNDDEMKYFINQQSLDDFSNHVDKINKYYFGNTIFNAISQSYISKAMFNFVYNQIKHTIFLENEYSLEWEYTEKAIVQLKILSEQINSKLIIFPLTNKNEQIDTIKELSQKHNMTLMNQSRLDDIFSPEYRLKNDGHFNESGHKKLAEEIINYISKKGNIP